MEAECRLAGSRGVDWDCERAVRCGGAGRACACAWLGLVARSGDGAALCTHPVEAIVTIGAALVRMQRARR